MFSHLIALKDKQRGADQPHRLAGAVPTGDAHPPATQQQRHGASRLGGGPAASPGRSTLSPRAQQCQGVERVRAGPLPAFRSRLDRHVGAPRRRHHLPAVRAAGDRPAAAYTSLDGLQRIAELFKGKHSTVCTYLDTCTGSVVAVKTYYKKTMAKRHFRNVKREVAINRMLARQSFTGAVQMLGTFEDADHVYLVLENCSGGDLYRRLVKAGGLLPEADVCRDVVVPLLLTLTFLHANHIVHRDIKPENCLYSADGGLRLGDFGLSIDARVERPTSRVGTLDYMAPEVLGMPSPDEMQRRGLAPHQVGHYGCKVDVWAVGILAYELICGQPPFEVEDVKLTEQHIKFADVTFPPHASPACRSFIQQALTKRPESRPTAAQLFQHPWVQDCYQQLLLELAQPSPAAAAAAGWSSAAQAAAAAAGTPELRRTASQPPSPSKSMPGVDASGRLGGSALTPAAVATALAPFLPLSQAKLAHKVRLLSPGRPTSARAARPRRRVSDPLARVLQEPSGAAAAAGQRRGGAAAAAEEASATCDAPPATPQPATTPPAAGAAGRAGGNAGLLAELLGGEAAVQGFETPGTPGLKTTPLPRQRPVPPAQQRGLLGRTPFLLPLLTPGGAGAAAAAGSGTGSMSPSELQPLASGLRGRPAGQGTTPAMPRSRFAAAAENDECPSLRASTDASSGLSSPAGPSRSASLSAFAAMAGSKDPSSSLELAARSSSFASFGGSSSGNLQLAPRAGSFSAFGGAAGGDGGATPGAGAARVGSCSPVGKQRSKRWAQGGADGQAGVAPAAALGEQLQRVVLS